MAAEEGFLDDLMPGKDLGSKEIVVDEYRVNRYFKGIDEESKPSPFDGPLSPVAILHYEPLRWEGARLPSWLDNLNSKAEWEFFKAVRLGDKLSLKCRISDRYIRRNREYLTIELSAYNEAGEIVCRGSGTNTGRIDPATARPDVPKRD